MNKKILIIVCIIICIGIVALVFFKTDTMKSDEELFWKYMSQNKKMLNEFKINIDNNTQESYYKNSIIKIESDNQYGIKEDITITKNTNFDNQLNNKHSNIIAQMGEQKLFEIDYLKNETMQAIKNEEVLNGYIAVKNENLNQLAIQNNYLTNQLNDINIEEIFQLSETEQEYLIQTYYNIIKDNIDKKQYSKRSDIPINIEGKQYTTNEYSINLTQKQSKDLSIKLLEKLKTDEGTLNIITEKLRKLNISDKYIEVIKNKIQESIEEIQKQEVTDEKYLTISVYESDGKTVCTDIKIKDKNTIRVSYIENENRIFLTQKMPDDDVIDSKIWKRINITHTTSQEEENISINIEFEYNNINIETKRQKLTNGYYTYLYIDLFDVRINYTENMQNGTSEFIPELADEKKIILNDLTEEKLKILINKIEERIKYLIEEKKSLLIKEN